MSIRVTLGFDSWPVSLLLHVTPPLFLPVSCHIFSRTINKAIKRLKKNLKKKKKGDAERV